MRKNNIVVFDFDETIFKYNSFKIWCRWLLVHSIRNLKFKLFIELIVCFICRKIFSSISHEDFKKKLIELSSQDIFDDFSLYLCNESFWNYPILSKVKWHLDNDDFVIISSAAPEDYLEKTLVSFGVKFDCVIGCKVINDCLIDNYKFHKANNLKEKMNSLNMGSTIYKFYTDSVDDFETMLLSENNYFIGDESSVMSSYPQLNSIKNLHFIKV